MEQQFNYLKMELIFLHHHKEFKKKGKRIFVTALSPPPKFTLENYKKVLFNEGLGQAFINTLAGYPSIIPLVICSFFAYALTWMQFFGRDTLLALVIASLVVPLQMSLIPLLSIYNDIGSIMGVGAKSYPGVWMAHTGFGLASTTFLLRNFLKSLPAEMMEAAKVSLRYLFKNSFTFVYSCVRINIYSSIFMGLE